MDFPLLDTVYDLQHTAHPGMISPFLYLAHLVICSLEPNLGVVDISFL
jgi:hypothetical protein